MKTTRQIAVWALVAGLMLLATPAHAQLEFGIENPRIFSIQPRPYRLAHEFQLGVGVMPLDAFYIGLTIGGSYTYHFSDFWAWEILSFHYSVNVDTSLEKSLFEEYGVIPVRGGGERTNLFATSALVVKPLFGKLALLNDVIVHAETFFTAGLGPFQSVSGTGESSYFDPAVMLGLGFRFWTFRWLSVRFEVRDYLVLKNMLVKQDDLTRQEEGLENQLMFELSAAFNFSLSDDDEKEAAFLAGDKGATP